MAALRKLGVRCVVAFSAVGSLREEIKPRDFVVPGQVIDRTKGVGSSYFLWVSCYMCLYCAAEGGGWSLCCEIEAHRVEGDGIIL